MTRAVRPLEELPADLRTSYVCARLLLDAKQRLGARGHPEAAAEASQPQAQAVVSGQRLPARDCLADTGGAGGFVLACVRAALLVILLVARTGWMAQALTSLAYLCGEFIWHATRGEHRRQTAAQEGGGAETAQAAAIALAGAAGTPSSCAPSSAGRSIGFQLAAVRTALLAVLLVAGTAWTTNVLASIVYLCGEFVWHDAVRGSAEPRRVAAKDESAIATQYVSAATGTGGARGWMAMLAIGAVCPLRARHFL